MDNRKQESVNLNRPARYARLCEIRVDPKITTPLGGLNPFAPSYDSLGQHFLNIFIEHAGLQPKHRVLEIGSGTGRIAKALSGFIDGGKYVGFDVNSYFVDWCKQNLQYPKFSYGWYDLQHDEFNPAGKIDSTKFSFPYADNSFNIVCAIALFNHLQPDTVVQYIKEISRVLVNRGIFIGTFMLLNQQSQYSINTSGKPYIYEIQNNDAWYAYKDRPLFNVLHPELIVRRSFITNHLMLREPIRYGEWCGSTLALTGHDVLIAKK